MIKFCFYYQPNFKKIISLRLEKFRGCFSNQKYRRFERLLKIRFSIFGNFKNKIYMYQKILPMKISYF